MCFFHMDGYKTCIYNLLLLSVPIHKTVITFSFPNSLQEWSKQPGTFSLAIQEFPV